MWRDFGDFLRQPLSSDYWTHGLAGEPDLAYLIYDYRSRLNEAGHAPDAASVWAQQSGQSVSVAHDSPCGTGRGLPPLGE
jgi:hypothetical protein